MTNYEIITIIISISGFFVAFSTFFNGKKIRELEESNLKHNMAQTELYIQELLVNSRKLFIDVSIEMVKLPNTFNQEDKNKFLIPALQEILNSYEIACAKYLDDKIDKERFKKTYFQEITELMNNKSYKNLLEKANSFQAIKKVNKEWNDRE